MKHSESKGGPTCSCEMQLPEQKDWYQQCWWDVVAACAKCQEWHSLAAGAAQQAGHCLCCWQAAFPIPLLLQHPAWGCCGLLPSPCSWKVLAGLFEPVALPDSRSTSAELASGPSGTTVTHNRRLWRALPFPVAQSLARPAHLRQRI